MAQQSLPIDQLQKALLTAEKSGNYSYDALEPIWEQAKEAIESEEQAVSIYTTYIYMTRRYIQKQGSTDFSRVEALFQEAIAFIAECFEEEYSEASVQLEKAFAFFLYTKLRKIEQAREIWNRLLDDERSPFPWIEAIALERAYGDVEHARRLFYKALNAVTFRPEEIFSKFVQFEREEGTREELDKALEQINAKAAEYNARLKQHQYKQQKLQKIRNDERGGGRPKKEQQRGKEVASKKKVAKQKEAKKPELNGGIQNEAKKAKAQPTTVFEEEDEEDMDTTAAVDRPPANFETSKVPLGPVIPGTSMEQNEEMNAKDEPNEKESKNEETEHVKEEASIGGKRKRKISSTEKSFPYNTGLERNKLFVKQLDWSCTNEELKNFFEQYGTVLDARIVTKWNGRSKGCAYVEFTKDDDASKALMQADGAKIRGRKISVYLSNPPPKKFIPEQIPMRKMKLSIEK